jgi:4-nitrophenyl phosphatase
MIFVVDIDGTIFLEGVGAIDWAVEFVEKLKKIGPVYIMTNNSTQSSIQIAEKVYPVKVDAAHILSMLPMVEYVIKRDKIKSAFYIGNFVLEQFILNSGSRIDEQSADAVFIGYTKNPKFANITKAARLLRKGARLYALGIDSFYPIFGRPTPGVGYLVGSFEFLSGQKPTLLGKPGTTMLDFIVHKEKAKKDEIIVIGDNPETDMRMANAYGCRGILVGKKEDKRATWCVRDLKSAMQIIEKL